MTPLSATAENFTPRKTSRNLTTSCVPTDNELDLSLSRTGPGKIENPHDVIEIDRATVGAAYPTKMNKPVAMADVAGASGPAVTGASGPVVAGTRFLAVAEVYSPAEEVEGDPPMDDMQSECRFCTTEEDVGSHPLEHSGVDKWVCPRRGPTECNFIAQEEDIGSHPLEHSGVEKWVCPRDGPAEIRPLDHSGIMTNSASCGEPTEREPLEHSVPRVTPCQGSEQSITDVQEQPEEGEAIVVGAVGSAAPWFLTGWTNNIEVEFMIDTGCQVTILATSVVERMCAADPQVRSRIRPCARRLVLADSSPLTVIGELELDVVFPGLKCVMCCVVASIGSDGLLGTEALQSCLPHQLDLRTGQLWAEGRATLQLHQQKPSRRLMGC